MNIILIILVIVLILIVIIAKKKLKQSNSIKESLTKENTTLEKRVDTISTKVATLITTNKELTEVINMKNKVINNYERTTKQRNEDIIRNIIFITDDNKLAENVKVKTIIDDLGIVSVNPTIRRKVANKWTEVPVKMTIK